MSPEAIPRDTCVIVGQFTLDLAARQVFLGSEPVDLQWRQFEALRLLVEANGEPVERERLLKALWPDVTVEEASLNQCISQLRKSLNDAPETGLIQTVPRRGYRLGVRPRAPGSTETVPVRTEPVRGPGRRRWLIVVGGLASVAVIAGWMGFRLSRKVKAEALVNEGLALVRLNQYQQAAAGNALLRRALELSPNMAVAYAGLAEGTARSSQDRPGQAKDLALKALELDPNCAQCLAIAGWVLMSKEWQWQQAMAYLSRAAKQLPGDARVHMWHAQILAVNGNLDEAQRAINTAVNLSPTEAPPLTMKAGILYLRQNYGEAAVTARKALALQPSFTSALNWLYRSLGMQRRFDESLAALSAQRRSFTGMAPETEYAQTAEWQRLLRSDGIERWVKRQLDIESSQPVKNMMRYEHATWRVWVGDREGALNELESLSAVRPYDSMYMAVDPTFAPLRDYPRFRKIAASMGLARQRQP